MVSSSVRGKRQTPPGATAAPLSAEIYAPALQQPKQGGTGFQLDAKAFRQNRDGFLRLTLSLVILGGAAGSITCSQLCRLLLFSQSPPVHLPAFKAPHTAPESKV